MRPRPRRGLALALTAAGLLGVAGCAGLPDTSGVIEGRRLDEPISDPVRVVPQGPVAGASPEAVALGFIRAGEDADENRETGKSYLAPSSVDLWRWSSSDVVVYDTADDLTVRRVGPERLEVRTSAVARVTPEGRYEEYPAGTTVSVTLRLTKVGGEWRIELPREGFGLWLDSNAFDRLYAARHVYYVTPSGRRLVPDTRWIQSGSAMATTLARAQLAPVPGYLAGVLTTGVPPNTKLAVNAVPVDSGRALVNLGAQARDAEPIERAAMWAQLTTTLQQVPAVQSVSLAVEGTPLELPGVGGAVSSGLDLGYETVTARSFETALLRRADRLTRIDPRDIPDGAVDKRRPDTTAQDGDPARIPEGWTRLALSVDGKETAAVGGDLRELSRWRGNEFLAVPPFGSGLSRPEYDSFGYLWIGGRAPDGSTRVWALATGTATETAVPFTVSAAWLAGRRVEALAVSPDSTRLLVVSTLPDGSDAQLGLTGIVRSPSGKPASLTTPWRQAQPLTLLRDVTWLETDTYAVLGRIDQRDPVRPWLGRVGAGLEGLRRRGAAAPAEGRLAPVPGGVSITSVGGPRGLVVITDEDRVLVRAGATWREIATGTDLLVPGR
ncbi:MAG TPA: GerMN domain-containing protein [Intrasporangium sp.]|uniref:GerMN domain-containing protein n=1 Tax=Intrasporangium sp. TaxID=1925024 RepID=UPI002D795882|nr:GerMN domain-containing protein [Intrasporangium sp.]HET7400010.1 GerMN domain-containing protein [Intrasporangium sp.]